MPDLPTGTVTFLFTDIEGSTALWERHRAAMQGALNRHDHLLRSTIESHGGHVFKTVGDAFCAVFNTAPSALQAALAAQRALVVEPWGDIGHLRVRMALHTGASEERDSDYFGPSVNRVARLLSAGAGGQILLSLAAEELVRDQLTASTLLHDLGEHRLKDLMRAEHIFQVVAPDLPADFPPLKTLGIRNHNLPIQRSPLIGREKEVAAAYQLLLRQDVGILTLTGPGGTGKTRLSMQIAADLLDHFADGVYFVPLAAITEPAAVAPVIAKVLGVTESGDQAIADLLRDYLQIRELLLVLDNFEQVLAGARVVSELIGTAPHLKVLVTSRSPLHLSGERELQVPPLGLPELRRLPPLDRLPQYASIRLFLERAQALRADFTLTAANAATVAEICIRLDGLPLAIELAAARIRLLTPQAMLPRLTSRLRLLTGGAQDLTPRQQTLRGAIDWSHDLLGSGEQTLFRRLAVFVGGCTIEAAEALCGVDCDLTVDILDGLASLVDMSLLKQEETSAGEPRFVMLETIREYGLERLVASGEAESLRLRHADYYLAMAEEAEPALTGPDQLIWLERLEIEADNSWAAIRRLLERGLVEQALRLTGALWRFWYMHGHLSEGRRWLEKGLAQLATSDSTVAPAVRAKALYGAGALARLHNAYTDAKLFFEASLALQRELEDAVGEALALNTLGLIALDQGNHEEARALIEHSLELRRTVGDHWGIAASLTNLGVIALDQGDDEQAALLYEESLGIWYELGDRYNLASALTNLGELALHQGNYTLAVSRSQESLKVWREVGDQASAAGSLNNLGLVALFQDDFEHARGYFVEGMQLSRDVGDQPHIVENCEGLAGIAARTGQELLAARLWGAAEALRDAISTPIPAFFRVHHNRMVAQARDRINSAAWEQAWNAGRRLSIDQAIAEALGRLD